MEKNSVATRLCIYASSTDKIDHTLLSEFLVNLAHKQGMAGATVLKGIMGFGASSVIHSYKLWEISEKVPVVVEIIDEEEKINAFYDLIKPFIDSMRYGCLVTSEKTTILFCKPGKRSEQNGPD